ncbi:MAG: TonB-dependent receptor domain-containing protein, partial [Burkholderiales bacterium]
QGKTPPASPPHSVKAWTSYELQGGLLQGLAVFGGVFAQTSWQGDNDNTFKFDGYARVDAGAAYRHRLGPTTLTWQVNVENLFDKEYFFGQNPVVITPGRPLTVFGSLRIEL